MHPESLIMEINVVQNYISDNFHLHRREHELSGDGADLRRTEKGYFLIIKFRMVKLLYTQQLQYNFV